MKLFFYISGILVVFSCKDRQVTEKRLQKNRAFHTTHQHDAVARTALKFQSDIDNWKAYQEVRIFLEQYRNISPSEALNNARELNEISKNLGDSIKPLFLETPAFNARINLFFNETSRLYDMSSITAIEAPEVNRQVAKILNAFSSINLKINGILEQNEFEQGVQGTLVKREFPENFEKRQAQKKSDSKLRKRSSKKSEEERLFQEKLLKKRRRDVHKVKKNDHKKND